MIRAERGHLYIYLQSQSTYVPYAMPKLGRPDRVTAGETA